MSSSRVFKGCRALMAAAKASSSPATKKPIITVSATPTATKKPTITVSATPTTKRVAGIQMVKPVSPALSKFLGVSEVSRSDATKKIWEHIKDNNLQTPEDKRIIVCDAKLKTIFDEHVETSQDAQVTNSSPATSDSQRPSQKKKGFLAFGFLDKYNSPPKSTSRQQPEDMDDCLKELSTSRSDTQEMQLQDTEDHSHLEEQVDLPSYGSDSELMCKKSKAGEASKIITRAQALAQEDFHLYSPLK
ncbi:SWIB/MDM2 domain superfamily protein [Thalictrum thalictroides]|uniref:SWIB/MDM2 domain superfamily protein n=1 Tax=Thalictrum thalictroides TaxID=46969 RepID=A0A7J6VJ00_THATH|nr:SWIB/MDM2 domain superfamily protein [Thalictrum thalictroides]